MIKPSQYGPLFLLAASLDGDLQRVASISGVPGPELAELADRLGWRRKLTSLAELREAEGPDVFAREINRLVNFEQATRARDLLTRATEHLLEQPPEELLQAFSDKGTRTWSARVLTDVAKAMETVQSMTYRALGDTATERRDERSFGAARLAAASRNLGQLAEALDAPPASQKSPRVLEAKAKAKALKEQTKKAASPESQARAQVEAALDHAALRASPKAAQRGPA